MARQDPSILADPPGWLEGRLPEGDRLVIDGRVSRLGRAIQFSIMLVASVLCFALYFPILTALFNLLKRGRAIGSAV
jgi:hypothetical protein